jgi:glutamyl-tRNA synthetase
VADAPGAVGAVEAVGDAGAGDAAEQLRALRPAAFVRQLIPCLTGSGPFAPEGPTDDQLDLLIAAAPLVQPRLTALDQAAGLLGFLFTAPGDFAPDRAEAEAVLTPDARPALGSALAALEGLDGFDPDDIQAVLEPLLAGEAGPEAAFAPLRVAVAGRRDCAPLFESMELLGRDETLRRLRAALIRTGG